MCLLVDSTIQHVVLGCHDQKQMENRTTGNLFLYEEPKNKIVVTIYEKEGNGI